MLWIIFCFGLGITIAIVSVRNKRIRQQKLIKDAIIDALKDTKKLD